MLPRKLAVLAAVMACISAGRGSEFDPAAETTNRLGLQILAQLPTGALTKNIVISPYSIASGLALAYAGADGATRTEMAAVLQFPADDTTVRKSFALLRRQLSNWSANSGGQFEWSAANRLYGQSGLPILEPFLAEMRDDYEGAFAQLDFRGNAETSRLEINSWVSKQTHERISNLLPPGGVSDRTGLVLVNASWLKAAWATSFQGSSTGPAGFRLIGQPEVNVPTMMQEETLGYSKERNFTAVTLPYSAGGLQLLILLPDADRGVDDLADSISPGDLRRLATIPSRLIDLFLPKFKAEGPSLPLGHALQSLGMKSAFDVPQFSADFTRIAKPTKDYYLGLSEVYHRVFLSVYEEGTEAAASTASVVKLMPFSVSGGPRPPPPPRVQVDHPFIVAIQDRNSGACLFLGKIYDPR